MSEFALYQRVEETMINGASFSNPFTETELRLSVTTPSGRPLGSYFTWYGFHDGDGKGGQNGNVWKFRLLFDYAGKWIVKAGFYVPGTNTPNGPSQNFSYSVSGEKAAGEHGHLHVDSGNRLRFGFADGTPWAPFPVHSSGLLGQDIAVAKDWIDRHCSRGIDALSVRFHSELKQTSGESGYWHYLLTDDSRCETWPANGAAGFNYTRFDIVSWRHNEQIIEYAQTKGVKLSIWFGISGLNPQYWSYGPTDYPNNTTLGPNQKLFIRYFLTRWAPYTNWWHWTVDSELEEPGGLQDCVDRNTTYAAELNEKNPWKTLITSHVLLNWTAGSHSTYPQWGLATLQRMVENTDNGATDCRSFIIDNSGFGMPVLNGEGVWDLDVAHTRVASWAHIMAGGFADAAWFGNDYNDSSWRANWDTVVQKHKDGMVEIGKLSEFFNRTSGIDINPCAPDNSPASVSGGNLALCLADPGKSYYIWADRGGEVSVNLTGQSGTYSVKRYKCTDLTTYSRLPDIEGGGVRSLDATPLSGFGNDYLFVITNTAIDPRVAAS